MGLDLLDLGAGLSYRRLAVLLGNPAPDSAFVRSVRGEDAEWTSMTQLLAHIADLLSAGNWQRGGGKGTKPKPIQRPGTRPKVARFGGTPMSLDEARERFGRK